MFPWEGTVKATLNATARQLVQVRYGYQKNSDKYAAFAYITPTGWGTIANDYKSILASHSMTITGRCAFTTNLLFAGFGAVVF